MTKKQKVWGVVALVAALLLGLVIGHYISKSSSETFGSVQTAATYATGPTVNNEGGLYLWGTDSNEGLEVAGLSHLATTTINGTLTISGVATNTPNPSVTTLAVSGASTLHAVSATTLSATTFAPSGISTMATTSITSLCVYNGTNWTKITFSGVTPSYATSTSCL